jgi:hypothetical protein
MKTRTAVTARKTQPFAMLTRVITAGSRINTSTARSDSRIQRAENPAYSSTTRRTPAAALDAFTGL